MINNVIIVAGFWALYFAILHIVYFIKEVYAWTPKPYSVLDNYPWICRKCLTTWALIAAYLSVGIIIEEPLFAIFGVILGAGTGFAIDYTQKERTVAYEDN